MISEGETEKHMDALASEGDRQTDRDRQVDYVDVFYWVEIGKSVGTTLSVQ